MKRAASLVLGAFLVAAGLYASVQVFRGVPQPLSWMGLALAALPPLIGVVGGARLRGPEGRPPLVLTALSGLGLGVTMAMSWRHGPAAGMVHGWAGAAFIGWAAWVRWLRPPG